jgi:hypothetical protein
MSVLRAMATKNAVTYYRITFHGVLVINPTILFSPARFKMDVV